jgi:autotransporter-associated beta strand protein
VIASYALNGDGNDASGNGQDFTSGTGVTYGVGRDGTVGGAAVLNGSSSFLYRPSLSQAPGSQMTISAWIRTSADGAIMTIGRSPSAMDGQQMFLISGGALKYWDYNAGSFGFNGAVSTQTVTSGSWRHVAFVKNGTTGTYYVDGMAAGTITGPDVAHVATDFCVGKDYRDNNQFFSGSIDDFRLYSRALSAQEIAFLAGTVVPSLNLANVSGGYGLGKDGPGTMVLSGTNTYTGPTTVLAGSLIITGASALPPGSAIVAAAGATVILQNGAQLTSFSGQGSLVYGPGAPAFLGGGDFTGTSDIVLSGSSTLTKAGTGSITLLNPSTYTGKTWVQQGGLSVSSLNSLTGDSYTWSVQATGFNTAFGAAVDRAGNVFVADNSNHVIKRVTPAGSVSVYAGIQGQPGSADGTTTTAYFNSPKGVTVDAFGNVFVADGGNHKIRRISTAGVVTTFAGSGVAGTAEGTGTTAQFNAPWSVAFDAQANLYVSDRGNHKIRRITPAGVVTTLAGSGSAGSSNGTGTAASFHNPASLVVDVDGNVYVADESNHQIRRITPAGVVTRFAGTGTAASVDGTTSTAQFHGPLGIAVDAFQNIYVSEYAASRVRVIRPNGTVTTIGGSSAGYSNGTGTAAAFSGAASVSVDALGTLTVVDTNNGALRRGVAASFVPASLSSSLGAPTTLVAATIDLGSLASSGALVFSGSAQLTNRPVNLAGTTGGGVLDQSGTGLLAFTGSVTATGAGSKTLTLQGGAAGSGVLSGVIANNSATNTTALLKQGAGTWTLSGASTYTGGTTVAAGILALSGGADRLATTGDIRVSGGTLDLGGSSQSTSGNVILSGGSIQNGTLRATGSNVELQSGLVGAILSGQSALETDLKARLSFEGNLNDGSSVGTHSGTWVGTGSFASTVPVGVGAGVSGAYFNGSTRVTLAGGDLNMNASTAFTVSVWIRTGFTDTATRVILGKSAGTGGSTPVLYVNSAGQVVYDIYGIGAVVSNSVVRTGNWVHVALTGVSGSNTLSLYINGVLENG